MEKKEVVSLFFKFGVLLRPDELDWLTKRDDSEIREIVASVAPKEELVRRMSTPKYDLVKNLVSKPSAITTELQNGFFNSRYQQMKEIIGSRIVRDWTSINSLPNRGEVFLTGIVRNIREGDRISVELEDPTGTATLTFTEKPSFQLDEFVAIRANAVGPAFFGKEILYPDIPLRPAAKGTGRGCFVSDLHLEEAPITDARRMFSAITSENVDWIFVSGDVGNMGLLEELVGGTPTFVIPGEADSTDKYPQLPLKTKRNSIVPLSNPGVVRVGGLTVLLCHRFETEMLRKRHLGPSEEILENDFLVLGCVPDIVGHGHDHKPLVANYKSTTLVNAGSLLSQPVPTIIDFATRDWKQLRL